jgi:hypothetical protein
LALPSFPLTEKKKLMMIKGRKEIREEEIEETDVLHVEGLQA